MILIVGGTGSGKRAFACTRLGLGPEDLSDGCVDERPAVEHAEQLVHTLSPGEAARALCGKRAVLMDEVGCGVVPLDAGERAWREDAGRLGCLLAERAEAVVRMVCGLPQVIKGVL